MPTISISKDYFNELVGHKFTMKEFEDLCFDYGLEAEEDHDKPGNIKVEMPANRYDLLSVEGLALAFSNYLKVSKDGSISKNTRIYKALKPTTHITVDASVKSVRQFVVGAIIRDTKFTQHSYDSFIDFQDKLHHNLGRKRTLVSIGTHDLDKIKGPFKYVAKPRDGFSFTPLGKTKPYTGAELMKLYESDMQLKNFLHIIEKSEVIPLILDAEDRILSMPPIINSEFSKIDLNTKNVFIEITATDKTKGLMALNAVLANYTMYCQDKFTFEQVEIKELDGKVEVTPLTAGSHTLAVKRDYLEMITGLKLDDDTVIGNLVKMGYGVTVYPPAVNIFKVEVPFYRNDVMHPCDVAEDLAIAVGYNKVPFMEPNVICSGKQDPLNKLTELVRHELAAAGYCECLNFALCSVEDLTTKMLKKSDEKMVEIANPKTIDFQVGRTSLLTGMIKSIVSNKSNELPIQLFEVADVVLLTKNAAKSDSGFFQRLSNFFSANETIGAVNERHLCIVSTNTNTSGLDHLHGTMDLLFEKLFGKSGLTYTLQENNAPYLFMKLQAAVYVKGQRIGEMGVVHPEVLKLHKWPYPVSMIELNFEKLVDNYLAKHD